MKNLVIVESPTKARTISRFLGKDYDIKFSMGHVIDLPKSKLGIDIKDDFAPQYELIEDKKKLISELKSAAKSAAEGSLPRRTFVAISQAEAALTKMTFFVSLMTRRADCDKAELSASHHNNAWVSKRTCNVRYSQQEISSGGNGSKNSGPTRN